MISPEEIRGKAERQYPCWQQAWLDGEAFFPREIPANKRVDANLAAAIEAVQRLRRESKEVRGFGYTVEWEERNSRTHGRNQFPKRIVFETASDLLKLIQKEREFESFTRAVDRIRARQPKLEPWIRTHRGDLLAVADDVDGLLDVVDYFLEHPRPNVFARELPVAVDTKFIERHQAVLGAWLDLLLPPHAIRADEQHFYRRFGLRDKQPLILLRFLDAAVQTQAGSPWSDCGVPLLSLAQQPLPATRVLIVENKINLLTLPAVDGAIGMGGLGNAVTDLRYVEWLPGKDVWYWGDLDADGFAILSRLRMFLPDVRSLMMDTETLAQWREAIGQTGIVRAAAELPNLTAQEANAYAACIAEHLRIEQERLPQRYVQQQIAAAFSDSAATRPDCGSIPEARSAV